MLTQWNTGWHEFDDMFSAFSQLRTRMDSLFEEVFAGPLQNGDRAVTTRAGWPRANLADDGNQLVLSVEVPGFSERDVKLTLNQNVLTLSGERKVEVPEGYSVHRRERADMSFTRSFALPCRVNAEHTGATVKDGILTVTLEKAADAMPRQITVNAAA
jgi:HSP20 family protein